MVESFNIESVAHEAYKHFCNCRGKFVPAGEVKQKVKQLDYKVLVKVIEQYAQYKGIGYSQRLYQAFPRLEQAIESFQLDSSWLI